VAQRLQLTGSMKSRSRLKSLLLNTILGAMIFCASLAVLILIWQSFTWLRYGYWEPVTGWRIIFEAGILQSFPELQWAGVLKIILWFFDQSAAFLLFGTAVVLFWVSIWMTKDEL
jgi:hypothetical protein